ncbi:MAG TPA: hypothetical protein VLH84_03045 [Patescibacteria group bacterium]|nr:hypothetical protein [Patescibacteria group bacterium]
MVQFNLLPDIKIEYLKAKRQKQLVMFISFIVTAISVTAMAVLLSVVYGVQKKSIADISKDITSKSHELKGTKDLDTILTVQNQLNSLPSLHAQKPVVTRLFGYIQQVTPLNATITTLQTDFVAHTISITGDADTLGTVNSFADTLKFATYHTDAAPTTETKAFSSVVLSTFTRDSKHANYTITLNYDPPLFDGASNATITIPQVNTRSSSGQTIQLFKSDSGQ